jgi:hypothetical protein
MESERLQQPAELMRAFGARFPNFVPFQQCGSVKTRKM